MSFRRLTIGHALAFVAALALLLVMAPDWYTDKAGENYRFYQHRIAPQINEELTPTESALEADAAEHHEKNAWQAPGAIDRVNLVALLVTAALAIAAAFLRAADRRVNPSPSALATLTGLVAAALVAYRLINPPGLNDAAVVKWAAPVGLLCVGLVALGSRFATLAERDRRAAPREDASAAETGDAAAPAR
jgi:hypothetical protein